MILTTKHEEALPSWHLLLLPSIQQPSTHEAVKNAYHQSLTTVLRILHDESLRHRDVTLIIAVTCSVVVDAGLQWEKAQSLLAGLYSLVALTCAEQGIETDIGAGLGSVDTRVLLMNSTSSQVPTEAGQDIEGTFKNTVVDLATLATRFHPWMNIFHPDSEFGRQLLSAYLKLADPAHPIGHDQIVVVQGGIDISTRLEGSDDEMGALVAGFDAVCLGGTFDHLHPGHKLLLHASALLLRPPPRGSGNQCVLVVGISGDELLVNKKYALELEPWESRARSVLSFLSTILDLATLQISTASFDAQTDSDGIRWTFRDGTILVRCARLHDGYGPTISEEPLNALCVSQETRSGGKAINDKRNSKGWSAMEVFEIDVLNANTVDNASRAGTTSQEARDLDQFAGKISSTIIRQRRAEARNTA